MDKASNIQPEIFSLDVNDQVKSIFLSLAKWAKATATLGFISMVICVFLFTMVGYSGQKAHSLPTAGKALYWVGYFLAYSVFVAAVGFYPNYALLRCANKIKAAFAASNQAQFEKAIGYLRNSFRYLAVLLAICLVLLLIMAYASGLEIMKLSGH